MTHDDAKDGESTPSKKQLTEEWLEYTQALGELIAAWNHLHQSCELLFSVSLQAKHHPKAYAVWHAIRSDRSQREMLRALVSRVWEFDENPLSPEFRREALWVCCQADTLENIRNDAAHAPVFWHPFSPGYLTPHFQYGNPKAKSFDKRIKNDPSVMVAYIRNCSLRISIVKNYCVALALWEGGANEVSSPQTFPQRPILPTFEKLPS